MLYCANECSSKLVEPVLKSQGRKIAGGCLAKVLCHGEDVAVEIAQGRGYSLRSLFDINLCRCLKQLLCLYSVYTDILQVQGVYREVGDRYGTELVIMGWMPRFRRLSG